tara:strand:+ start:1354 stop:1644 length:291 start_codon:yes stop_codon:yes gene_type:complete
MDNTQKAPKRIWATGNNITGSWNDTPLLRIAPVQTEYVRDDLYTTQQATIDALTAALATIAKQETSKEWEAEGDTEHGYDCIINVARAALGGITNG